MSTFAAVESGSGREGIADIASIFHLPSPFSASIYGNHITKGFYKSVFYPQMANTVQNLRRDVLQEFDLLIIILLLILQSHILVLDQREGSLQTMALEL